MESAYAHAVLFRVGTRPDVCTPLETEKCCGKEDENEKRSFEVLQLGNFTPDRGVVWKNVDLKEPGTRIL